MASTALEKEIGHGNTGLVPWSEFGDVEETVPELIGQRAITTYNKMRQDAQSPRCSWPSHFLFVAITGTSNQTGREIKSSTGLHRT